MSDEQETHAPPEGSTGTFRAFTVVAVICLGILLTLSGLKSWRDLATARARQQALEQRVEDARERIEDLQLRVHRLGDDPVTLERLAREELGLVKPGELVIVLPKVPTPADEPAPQREPSAPAPR